MPLPSKQESRVRFPPPAPKIHREYRAFSSVGFRATIWLPSREKLPHHIYHLFRGSPIPIGEPCFQAKTQTGSYPSREAWQARPWPVRTVERGRPNVQASDRRPYAPDPQPQMIWELSGLSQQERLSYRFFAEGGSRCYRSCFPDRDSISGRRLASSQPAWSSACQVSPSCMRSKTRMAKATKSLPAARVCRASKATPRGTATHTASSEMQPMATAFMASRLRREQIRA